MTGGSESAAGEKDGGTALIAQIPVGWQRKVEDGVVSYIRYVYTLFCVVYCDMFAVLLKCELCCY